MLNFSQINKSGKWQKQKEIQDSIQFKIQPPISERKTKQLTQQSSYLDQSQKANSSVCKNTARSSCSGKLQQQYISFKLKPSSKKHDSWIENNQYKINFQKKCNESWQNNLIQNQLQLIESEKNSLAKSPQFLCKNISLINSEKQFFEESFEQNPRETYGSSLKPHYFKMTLKESICNENKIKNTRFDNLPQFENEKVAFNNDSFKLISNQDFQEDEVNTPYKELMNELDQRQQIGRTYRFDSFNHSNSKENFNHVNYKKDVIFDNFESFQKKSGNQNIMPDKSLRKRISNQIQNQDINKQFFFLTNPTIEQDLKTCEKSKKCKEVLRTPKQKQVKEFCFNVSSIKLHEEKPEQPYCNPNLFSNSNEYMMLFDSRNVKKSQVSQNSKRMHVRQLVEEFIQQLQHIDDKSLNQKVVSNLQNVLQEIVFKEPKYKDNTFTFEEPTCTPKQSNLCEVQNSSDTSSFKKWTKPKRQSSQNSIPCNRKLFNQLNQQKYENFSYEKEQNISPQQNLRILSKYSYDNRNEKSPLHDEIIETEKKENKKLRIYKPNFDFSADKNQFRKFSQNKKEELNPQQNLMFTKHRQNDSSQMKINPKSSIYFNNTKSKSRQRLKTETDRKTWRVY